MASQIESSEVATMVNLISSENEAVQTSLKCATMSMTIKEMCNNLSGGGAGGDMISEIPVVTVTTKTLKKIVEWLEKWQDAAQPTLEEIKQKRDDTIDSWDEEYLKMDLQDLYALVSDTKSIIGTSD